jgi:sucrose phosphorylase
MEGNPKTDLSMVVRPRSTPLLTPYQTRKGERHIWTTFSADQVDLDWTSPDLLFEFLDIILYYVSIGCKILRLDAVAFLWKKIGTDCLHLPETHEIIKLIRNFLEVVAPDVVILTETNVPHEENISYFGKGDEAHAVYQFSLPPLSASWSVAGNF